MKTDQTSKTKKLLGDILPMTIAEIAVGGLTCLVALLLDVLGVVSFSYRIPLGSLLGILVILLNYVFLILSVDKAIADYLKLVDGKEMDEEEAERFAQEHAMPVQNAIKISFIARTVSMLAALIVAFILDWFNPIATAIPLLAFRPLLTLIEIIKGKVTHEEK